MVPTWGLLSDLKKGQAHFHTIHTETTYTHKQYTTQTQWRASNHSAWARATHGKNMYAHIDQLSCALCLSNLHEKIHSFQI